ncbi:hypothetical protein BCO26_0642 [Heyndrickxia coagulans 2-6]|nr:hypothetical protein BCO26_0642 [Heyndrickxia coagulans 2-6]
MLFFAVGWPPAVFCRAQKTAKKGIPGHFSVRMPLEQESRCLSEAAGI